MARLSIKPKVLLLASLTLLTATAFGQDLGSSNKLFGGAKKSAAPSKTIKKPVAKPKTTVSKAKSAPKKKTLSPKSVKNPGPQNQSTASEKPKFKEFKNALPAKVETVKAPLKVPTIPTGAAADDKYEELIEDGNIARDDRNYSAAETAYKRAKSVKPRDSRAVYGLGNLYSDQQRWEEAEGAYRTALQLEPANAIAHIALSYVLTQPIAAPNLSERYEEAEKLARRSIQLAASNALAFDQLGVALELRGLIGAETESAYRRAIQLDASFAPAYAHLGRLLRRRGLTRESAAAYQNAIQRSNDVATMILVADVMQSEQRFAESEVLLKKALKDDPKNPSALLMLGRALTTQAKYSDAERVLRTILDVSPNAYMANSLLGSLYSRQGKFDLADYALLRAVQSVSQLEKRSLSQQFETVGDGYMKIGKARNAERAYRQAVALDPEKESLVGKLAKAKTKQ